MTLFRGALRETSPFLILYYSAHFPCCGEAQAPAPPSSGETLPWPQSQPLASPHSPCTTVVCLSPGRGREPGLQRVGSSALAVLGPVTAGGGATRQLVSHWLGQG